MSPRSSDATTAAGEAQDALPAPGTVFARRYLVERLLGTGGMGTVWAVLDRNLGETVALKVLDGSVGDLALQRFRREVRLARRVTHHNVARIYDIGEHAGTQYLTMELVRGQSLATLLATCGALAVERAVAIAGQIADGLAAAHEAGIVHRDLKPANVLIADRVRDSDPDVGRVVLTDFGIALPTADTTRLTADRSALLGTPAYMAPEQVRGEAVDARTDVYALGLVLYEMLTANLPFAGDTALELAIARLDHPAIDPRDHVAIPDAIAELVLQCLHIAPSARPADAAAVRTALARIVQSPPAAPIITDTIPAIATGVRLAVLPMRYRGPDADAYMADTLSDELVDLLSATRGLRVMASAATSRFAGDRDPFLVGRELGVDVVVDGTVHRAGTTVRISARLIDVASGFQTWSGRFDGELQDVFELQDLMAKKIAETLRLEIETGRLRGNAPAAAIELYLRARALTRKMTARTIDAEQVVPLFDECLALAPGFAPALAGRATACLRGWFRPDGGGDTRERAARDAVAAAKAGAPVLAETHLALARLAVLEGRYAEAAASLGEALRIAPTYPEAHEYLGSLSCEAGRPERGIHHLRLAAELDPGATFGLLAAATHHALEGERAESDALIERMRDDPSVSAGALRATEIRVAAWFGDTERMSALADAEVEYSTSPLFREMLRAYVGLVPARDSVQRLRAALGNANPRFQAMFEQFATEALCVQGDHEPAWASLQHAAHTILVDLHWLDRCPLIAPLRAHPDFAAVREVVRQRAEAIWAVP
jgi:serine/threonine-protein kinase